MTGNKTPEDPSEAPTGSYETGEVQGDPKRSAPWYRRPIISLTIALFAAILLGIALYLLADKTRGTGGTTQTPTSPTMSTSLPTTSPLPTTVEPATPSESTAATSPATTEPSDSPTTSPVEGSHHHHHHHEGGTP